MEALARAKKLLAAAGILWYYDPAFVALVTLSDALTRLHGLTPRSLFCLQRLQASRTRR
jgi:hypothetical protein